jgi:acetyl-CoA carboxylase biotin carboxyl carrier protein
VSAAFQVADVEELLAVMTQWGIAELHLSVEDASLDLVRAVAPLAPVPDTAAMSLPATAPSAVPTAEDAAREPLLIYASVVGVFRLATRGYPQQVPYVGDTVRAGQHIGVIELMHIPTDLVSPVSGTIEGILADDGAGVEYGQPLMVIRPFAEVSEDEAGI